MPSYTYVVLFPPESAEGLENRLAEVEWRRTAQDLSRGAIELTGTFENEETAMSQLQKVFPRVESAVPGMRMIIPSETADDLIKSLIGSVDPVQPGRTPVALGGVEVGATGETEAAPATDKDQKVEPATGNEKPKVAAPEIGAVAQNIDAGLKAIGIPPELWASLPDSDKKELAREFLNDLHQERSAYGKKARWTFASDAELLDLAPNGDNRSALAVHVLQVRAGIAAHQLDAAKEEINLQKQSVEYAKQDVELRKKAVDQQGVATDILKELLAHFKRWRALSIWGVILLTVALVFSMVLMVWLVRLARDDKLTDWALPTAIFALALFVISPAVLLLRERPLKGLDEASWPGAESSKPQDQAPASGGAAPAATAPAATAPAATTSATTDAA